MSRQISRRLVSETDTQWSDQLSKPFSICVPLLTTEVYMVDHIVTYVLYHSDQVSPDRRDMNSK